MSERTSDSAGIGDGSAATLPDHEEGAGFVMLGLAQICMIFGFWFGVWPAAFRLSARLGRPFAALFGIAGILGFYLAFRSLSPS